MDADGGNQERLTNNPAYDSDPAWSPDRTKIAFVSNRNGGFDQIYVMDAYGKHAIRLTDGLRVIGNQRGRLTGKGLRSDLRGMGTLKST